MLNFIYYPVSAIMWFWHKVFGFVLGESSGFAWALSVVFLVFTLRAILYKPFVGQVRSMRKMQEMQPEMQRLKKKYGNDRQKLAAEMQKLQQSSGANPLGGCLPILVQIPVFIGLFHVLREFKPGKLENYVFNAQEVQSFVDSDLLGSKLGAAVFPLASFGGQGIPSVEMLGGDLVYQWIVMIPLMIAAGVFTHITARHSVARQQAMQTAAMDNGQQAIMQKLMLYVFPIGVVVGAPFLPLAILFYWVSNNLWTLGQQYLVYKRIDAEETEKRDKASEAAKTLAPKPGQKPVRPQDRKNGDATAAGDDASETADAPTDAAASNGNGSSATNGTNGSSSGASADGGTVNGSTANGSKGNGATSNGSTSNGSKSNGSKGNGSTNGSADGSAKKPGAKPVGTSGKRPQGGQQKARSGSRPSGGKKKRR